MNKEQRIERNKKIIELRLLNKSYPEIAETLGTTAQIVALVSKKNNLGGKRSDRKATYKPASIPQTKTDDEVARFIKERLPQFEYAGNYTGCDGTADIRHLACGIVATRSMITIRHRNVKCRVCEQKEKERIKQEALELKQFEAEERKRQQFWSRSFNQIEMKQCPTCRAFFIGKNKYCSDKCAHHNKWHMKDGYRKLFPLKEVYKRDGGICYLCGKPCDWDDFFVKDGVIIYGNNYPSRDHVVPKSKGGANDWENIRLAHRGCNAKKHTAPWSKK